MLKKLLISPLLDANQLNLRLDAIEDLEKNSLIRKDLRESLNKLPDLERITTRIY
jgi:DNA mismatch repair ATPase MutS